MDTALVKAWMEKERWTCARLARRMEIDPSTMWRYLNNKTTPKYPFVSALAHLMGVDEDKLRAESGRKKKAG